ncbi:unnamed protein product [Heligmosomoides polygyrus]|uniref:Uncharacterized protein n=1 Tax=Heligmosomoides polygyrus TaxID=6339 RepID=A0A3P8BN52_HELPZ|nr:unnamed protein product [Heligmosomoides polygyrus]
MHINLHVQIRFRIVTCCFALLWGCAQALLSDEECAHYHELRTPSDYDTFIDDCAGKEVLGFEDGVAKKFYAINVDQASFNKLFANAKQIGFHIYVESTEFTDLKLLKLEKFDGGLTIRDNTKLVSFRIRRGFQFSRIKDAPTSVTVDGNAKLNAVSMADLRYLCSYCDIFEWTKCSSVTEVNPSNYAAFFKKCEGEKIIKSKPHTKLVLDLSKVTVKQFESLFAQATHIQMCIVMRDVPWEKLVFPKLVRFLPCGLGDRALKAVHNANLKQLSFPMYESEGFGLLNFMVNIELRNNFVLSETILISMQKHCRFCTIQPYRECNQIEPRHVRNATKFVELCGGKKIMRPALDYVLVLDISSLTQELVDELFQDVISIKMCIKMQRSRITHLRMPNLIELQTCQAGQPAFLIEGNLKLTEIQVSKEFKWSTSQEAFHIILAPSLKIYPSLSQCKYCVLELTTNCGATTRGLTYTSLSKLLDICPRKRKIVFRESVAVTEDQFSLLVSEALYLEMCFVVHNSDYTKIVAPKLYSIRPCKRGMPVFSIVGNPELAVVTIPETVIYEKQEKILLVKSNPRLPPATIVTLKKICPLCEIEGFFSKCAGIKHVGTLDEFMKTCAGQPIISGKHGLVLKFNFTEVQLNQLFSGAVEVRLCLNIRASMLKQIEFPKLTSWRSCGSGKPAINFINNPHLEKVRFPACTKKGGCIESGVVMENPNLSSTQLSQIRKWCPACKIGGYTPACGLSKTMFSVKNFVRACAGLEIIKSTDMTINGDRHFVIDSSQVTETEMNKFCSRAVYMEVCIRISESSYRSLRCPLLQELRPCAPGKPALEIVGNLEMTTIFIPVDVIIPAWKDVIVVSRNPLLSPMIIEQLKKICPSCQIDDDYSICSGLDAIKNIEEFIGQCTGQPIIASKPGVVMNLTLTEAQVVVLFRDVVEVQMYQVRPSSLFRIETPGFLSPRYPFLCRNDGGRSSTKAGDISITKCKVERAGGAGGRERDEDPAGVPSQVSTTNTCKPALTVISNPHLENLRFPACKDKTCIESIMVKGNPSLPNIEINILRKWCTRCDLRYEPPYCGTGKEPTSMSTFIKACAGKDIIKPAKNGSLTIDISQATQREVNLLCSKVFYLEACIVMRKSALKYIVCPALREMRPCATGKPVFEIVDNSQLIAVGLPSAVTFPVDAKVLVVTKNPVLSLDIILSLKQICPYCEIVEESKCSNLSAIGNINDFLNLCGGQQVIIGQPGFTIDFAFTQAQIDLLFGNAVEVKMCLVIHGSAIGGLNFPKLKRWTPCAPGKASITVVSNPHLKQLDFPACRRKDCIENAVIKNNPLLRSPTLNAIRRVCKNCEVENYVPACGLGNKRYTVKQFVTACAGKEVIKPADNYVITIDASAVTEHEMNKFCSRAIYLEACISFSGTMFRSFRCPRLREVKACSLNQGRNPVFKIVNNAQLEIVDIPETVIYPRNQRILVVKENPKLPYTVIANLKKICPSCEIVAFNKSKCTNIAAVKDIPKFLKECSGQPVISGKPGLTIQVDRFTEQQLKALFSNVYELQLCLVVKRTRIRSLVFPKLVLWRSCAKDKPAITLVDNWHLKDFLFPSCERQGCIESGYLHGNTLLPRQQLMDFGLWCSNCVFDRSPPACGIQKPHYTLKEFIKACAGKEIITQRDNYYVVVNASLLTEVELNNFCSKAVKMKICIVISRTRLKALRCPNLQELTPCAPGRPAIQVVNNTLFENLFIPSTAVYPKNDLIIEIKFNLHLQLEVMVGLKAWCPKCVIYGGQTVAHPTRKCSLDVQVRLSINLGILTSDRC